MSLGDPTTRRSRRSSRSPCLARGPEWAAASQVGALALGAPRRGWRERREGLSRSRQGWAAMADKSSRRGEILGEADADGAEGKSAGAVGVDAVRYAADPGEARPWGRGERPGVSDQQDAANDGELTRGERERCLRRLWAAQDAERVREGMALYLDVLCQWQAFVTLTFAPRVERQRYTRHHPEV